MSREIGVAKTFCLIGTRSDVQLPVECLGMEAVLYLQCALCRTIRTMFSTSFSECFDAVDFIRAASQTVRTAVQTVAKAFSIRRLAPG